MDSLLANSPKLLAWYKATRPRVFTATYVPILLAGAVALQNHVFRIIPFILALIGTMALQAGANLVNEYFDYRRGADELKQAGQGMTIKNNILSPREVLIGAIVTIVVGSLIGIYLVSQSGSLLWIIGILGVFAAITYTAGPFPLAYNGLGELTAGIVFGPLVVVGAYYVMDTNISFNLVLISLPIGFMVAAILHANNIRDYEADKAVNKRTTTVLFGLSFAKKEYAFLVFGAYLGVGLLVIFNIAPPLALLALLTLPQAYPLVVMITTETDPQRLHIAQGRTAQLHGRFGYALAIGWVLSVLVTAVV
ncbi:MAG: 1,4-dihydroxy-2-naphthoate octaprenyltransferase [Anaerolineae bacterium]|nr:1,4-dihydroxy-2-naphthoate octaprenyltransferase [Anaerolineae bacterium]